MIYIYFFFRLGSWLTQLFALSVTHCQTATHPSRGRLATFSGPFSFAVLRALPGDGFARRVCPPMPRSLRSSRVVIYFRHFDIITYISTFCAAMIQYNQYRHNTTPTAQLRSGGNTATGTNSGPLAFRMATASSASSNSLASSTEQ